MCLLSTVLCTCLSFDANAWSGRIQWQIYRVLRGLLNTNLIIVFLIVLEHYFIRSFQMYHSCVKPSDRISRAQRVEIVLLHVSHVLIFVGSCIVVPIAVYHRVGPSGTIDGFVIGPPMFFFLAVCLLDSIVGTTICSRILRMLQNANEVEVFKHITKANKRHLPLSEVELRLAKKRISLRNVEIKKMRSAFLALNLLLLIVVIMISQSFLSGTKGERLLYMSTPCGFVSLFDRSIHLPMLTCILFLRVAPSRKSNCQVFNRK